MVENHQEIKIIKEYAKENNVPIMLDDGINFLTTFIIKHQIKNVLEVGTAIGYSAIMMALSSPNVKITSIERDRERYLEAVKNVKKFDLEDRITLIYNDAELVELKDQYDLIFIDAAKGKYTFFLEQALRMLDKKGIIFADNILYKGYVLSDYNKHKQRTAVRNLREYIKQTTENAELETQILEVGDGLAITHFCN